MDMKPATETFLKEFHILVKLVSNENAFYFAL